MRKIWVLGLLGLDVLSAMASWCMFYIIRATWLEH